jgi:hypothetical protein
MTGREDPPNAGAIDAPPRVRNKSWVPSGDHCGIVSTAVESSDNGIVLPPAPVPTGRMKIRIRMALPAA